MPTLTPFRVATERAIAEKNAQLDALVASGEASATEARLSRAIVDSGLLAMADEFDMLGPMGDMTPAIQAFESIVVSLIDSVLRSVATSSGTSPENLIYCFTMQIVDRLLIHREKSAISVSITEDIVTGNA